MEQNSNELCRYETTRVSLGNPPCCSCCWFNQVISSPEQIHKLSFPTWLLLPSMCSGMTCVCVCVCVGGGGLGEDPVQDWDGASQRERESSQLFCQEQHGLSPLKNRHYPANSAAPLFSVLTQDRSPGVEVLWISSFWVIQSKAPDIM